MPGTRWVLSWPKVVLSVLSRVHVAVMLFMSPLMIPHLVLGIAFLRFFTQIGLGGTFAGPRRILRRD